MEDRRRAAIDAALKRTGGIGRGESGIKHDLSCFVTLLRQGLWQNLYAGEVSGDADEQARECLAGAADMLESLIRRAWGEDADKTDPTALTDAFLAALPEVTELISLDVAAAYDGDPAARSTREIMCAYPTFEALTLYRPAHVLYTLGVPLIPRMMTEYAHRITGIDIHPGATIGRRFFIDHGTGVVIGETCTVGDNVKLYQGVTLGAKSFPTDENGHPVKGIRRHPTIGNDVIVYAGATILGGDTVIGDGAVIGGNVWLTHSVPAGAVVTVSDP